ncbi:MAG: ribonuclease P protein component [Pseudonocardiaceae bacterium]
MLPAATRLTRRDEFATAVRRGRRAAAGSVVVHLARLAAPPLADGTTGPKVGFVVGRTVGGSVIRHRVQRRLRHLMRSRLAALPSGALVVVRALPAAADASSAALGDDLDAALRRLVGSRTMPSPAARSSGGRR